MLEPNTQHDIGVAINGRMFWMKVAAIGDAEDDAITKKLLEAGETTTGLLPFGCRYLRRRGGKTTYLIEYPPQTMFVRFQTVCGPIISRLAIPIRLPWQVHIFDGPTSGPDITLRMFWRNSRIRGFNDELLNVVMPNMEPGGIRHVPCLGNMPDRLPASFEEKITAITQHLLASPLNDDLDTKIQRMLPDELARTMPSTVVGDTPIPLSERRNGSAADFILRLHAWTTNPETRERTIPWRSAGLLSELL